MPQTTELTQCTFMDISPLPSPSCLTAYIFTILLFIGYYLNIKKGSSMQPNNASNMGLTGLSE